MEDDRGRVQMQEHSHFCEDLNAAVPDFLASFLNLQQVPENDAILYAVHLAFTQPASALSSSVGNEGFINKNTFITGYSFQIGMAKCIAETNSDSVFFSV